MKLLSRLHPPTASSKISRRVLVLPTDPGPETLLSTLLQDLLHEVGFVSCAFAAVAFPADDRMLGSRHDFRDQHSQQSLVSIERRPEQWMPLQVRYNGLVAVQPILVA